MDIQTFVRDSLIGIANGIREANGKMNEGADPKRTYFGMIAHHKDSSQVDSILR